MTIPPIEVPPSEATNEAVVVPIGTDPDLHVHPDEPEAEEVDLEDVEVDETDFDPGATP